MLLVRLLGHRARTGRRLGRGLPRAGSSATCKAHDDEYGQRTLDVVDVHYYPQSDVFNDETDEETNARRLRSTRSLWDPTYADESWIDDAIWFIPRIKEIIERALSGHAAAHLGVELRRRGAR